MALDDQKMNDEDKTERLHEKSNQDGAPPFAQPSDVPNDGGQDDLSPDGDSDVDSDDEYNNGRKAAANWQDDGDQDQDQDQHARRIA